ncbi:uncharacterized protein LOC107489532 [Arachis duranensis]|uniref:Uncharacterized protein LOC107489532 n=1 Tax=Arachis duranensis TaxID=130453 RepID=A0A6P4DC12_ARADU|nr:uncharacterized protein LOC107489532 [Arachis duranensis]
MATIRYQSYRRAMGKGPTRSIPKVLKGQSAAMVLSLSEAVWWKSKWIWHLSQLLTSWKESFMIEGESSELPVSTVSLPWGLRVMLRSAIPSQPQPNSKGGINAITLRSGTQLKEKKVKDPSSITITQEEEGIEIEEIEEEEEAQAIVEDEVTQPTSEVTKNNKRVVEEEIAQPIPFLTLAKKARKRMELDPKMIEMFKKVEDRILELEAILLESSIFALMGALPEKCDDPGPCMVTCTVNGVQFLDCTCDLGACVSVMPLSVYRILRLPPLKRSTERFVLADKSIITVTGVAEDVLVNIKGLVFLIDFYVLEMPSSESERASSILLGRPFLRTSRFKLDAYSGTYSFEIDGRVVSFSLEEAMKYPPENHSLFQCDLIDNIVAEVHLAKLDEKHMIEDTSENPSEANASPHPCHPEVQTSSEEQKVELKPLPPHLKYSYLDEAHKFPVIITKELNPQQKEKLLCILRKNKRAIGWSLADLVGISPKYASIEYSSNKELDPFDNLKDDSISPF